MKAIILAAGAGRRMMPLSRSTHKTLLEVGGRKIIDRLIDGLEQSSIREVVIVTGYRAEELESHVVEEFPDLDFSFVRNEKYETTNNIQSLALALESIDIDDDMVLLESDLIYEPAVLRRVVESKHDNVAVVDRYRLGLDGTVVALDEGDVVSQVIPASMQGPDFSFSDKYKTLNIYKFSAEFCRTTFRSLLSYYSQTIDSDCYYELILGVLIYMQQVKVHAEVLSGEKWAEVDDPNDLSSAEFVFAPERRRRWLDSSWGGYWNASITDYAFIRNMHFPPDSMLSQMRAFLPELIMNYGSAQTTLDEKLANFLCCDPRNVHFLNGASQFFAPTLRSWFTPDNVLVPKPTFGEYNRIFPGARTYADRGSFSASHVLSHATGTDLVVVVNPNNPTGTTAATAEVKKLISEAPDRTVLVDESFIDFSMQPSLLPWLEDVRPDNVIVLKSLSKVLGVPGLRIGFVYTTNRIWSEAIMRDIPVWNVNSMAEHFMEIILKYPRDLERSFEWTKVDRAEFAAGLDALNVVETVYPSGGNFLLIRLGAKAEQAQQMADTLLLRDDIYVKDASAKFSDGRTYWRLAVRTRGENSRFCAALKTALHTASA